MHFVLASRLSYVIVATAGKIFSSFVFLCDEAVSETREFYKTAVKSCINLSIF